MALKKYRRLGLLVLLAGILTYYWHTRPFRYDPAVFLPKIERFEALDKEHPPPLGAVLSSGSSSLEKWTTMEADLAPLPIINRGIGGMRSNDPLIYYDRLVKPYAPSIIVYYAGDNDPNKKLTGDTFRVFVERVHADFPATHIFFLSIKPSPKRAADWPTSKNINTQVKMYCSTDPRLHFVDVASAELDGERIREELFQSDRVHIIPEAYAAWTAALKPELLKVWAQLHPIQPDNPKK